MKNVEIAETDDTFVILVDKHSVDRFTVERAVTVLEHDNDFSHIPEASDEEQADLVRSLEALTEEEKAIAHGARNRVMKLRLLYSAQATKFLAKNSGKITIERVEDAIRSAMRKLISRDDIAVDVIKMKGEWKGHWRIRIGGIRIIFHYEGGNPIIVHIEKIEFRGSVY